MEETNKSIWFETEEGKTILGLSEDEHDEAVELIQNILTGCWRIENELDKSAVDVDLSEIAEEVSFESSCWIDNNIIESAIELANLLDIDVKNEK